MLINDYRDAYIFIKKTISIEGETVPAAARLADDRNNKITFKDCRPITDCISELNNTQIDNTKHLEILCCRCII